MNKRVISVNCLVNSESFLVEMWKKVGSLIFPGDIYLFSARLLRGDSYGSIILGRSDIIGVPEPIIND